MPVSRPTYPPKRGLSKPHLIDSIKFSENRVVCICAWAGTIPEWDQHRKLNGSRR